MAQDCGEVHFLRQDGSNPLTRAFHRQPRHRVVFLVPAVDVTAVQHRGRGELGIVWIDTMTWVPFSIQPRGVINYRLIDSGGLEL